MSALMGRLYRIFLRIFSKTCVIPKTVGLEVGIAYGGFTHKWVVCVLQDGYGFPIFFREAFWSPGEIDFSFIFLKYFKIWLLIFLSNPCHCLYVEFK
jgi:hypothetical protein